MGCLNNDELNALCNGLVDEEAAEAMFEHIRTCRLCEEALNEIETHVSSAFRSEILSAARSAPFCDEPQLTAALTIIRDSHTPQRRIDKFPFQLTPNLSLIEELSSGGVGTVFEALEGPSDRRCALKILDHNQWSEPAQRRFEREIRLLQSLDHPNIVSIWQSGTWRGIPYLVTEFIEGDNLAVRVHRHGPLELSDALRCALQVARGLRYAHGKSIIHRDLTPANLLLDCDDVVRIIDLGLAKALGGDAADSTGVLDRNLTPRGAVAGTRPYMSPEQLEGLSNADARSDIYSLGATLCFLLTGTARGKGQLLAKPRAAAGRDDEQFPESVRCILRKMLAEKPQDRYQTMDEVVSALADVLKSL